MTDKKLSMEQISEQITNYFGEDLNCIFNDVYLSNKMINYSLTLYNFKPKSWISLVFSNSKNKIVV